MRVLRPPIDGPHEGQLETASISPGGRIVVCTGSTGQTWDGTQLVYWFDTTTGYMVRHRPAMGVNKLKYSPDGKWIAACTERGLELWRESDGALDALDAGSESVDVDFDAKGRLVASFANGEIRLYAPGLRRLATRLPLETPPSPAWSTTGARVAISRDGAQVALGDAGRVAGALLSGADLSWLGPLDMTAGVSTLVSVGFTAHGAPLFAGHNIPPPQGSWRSIRVWPLGQLGPPLDLSTGAVDSLLMLKGLSNGMVVFVSAEPSWGTIQKGSRRTFVRHPGVECRDIGSGFQVSADAGTVRFAHTIGGLDLAAFSPIRRRFVQVGSSGTSTLNPPKGSRSQAEFDGFGSDQPKFNRLLLPREGGRFLCATIAPDGKSFVLGRDTLIQHVDRSGNLIWSAPAPDLTWAVNASADGRWIVAAFHDGTIRWYRKRDGKELLALFPHNDRRRWILWTPAGYYDCSVGGEDLIGFHVNRGKYDAADFFPASRFRDRLYRPELGRRVLETCEETGEVSINTLPPVVTILEPKEGAFVVGPVVHIRYSVLRDSNTPLSNRHIFVDGRTVATSRSPGKSQSISDRREVYEEDVLIRAGETRLGILAESQDGMSPRSEVTVKRPVQPPSAQLPYDTLWIIAVGVGKYSGGVSPLQEPVNDVRAFSAVFQEQRGTLCREVMILPLVDEQATENAILKTVVSLSHGRVGPQDLTIVYFSGHGQYDGLGYGFLPFDSKGDLASCVRFDELLEILKGIKGTKVMFIDTCNAAAAVADVSGTVNQAGASSIVMYAACGPNGIALESRQWGGGALTKASIRGLKGDADYFHDRKVMATELMAYIGPTVREMTNNDQQPSMMLRPGPDLILSVLRKTN